MPTFIYTAADNDGKILTGELETADKKTVMDYLVRQNNTVISVKIKNEAGSRLENIFLPGLSTQDKIMLTKHLSTFIKSGLSLKEGLETILNDTRKKTLKKILTETKFNLEKGQQLSATFKKYPRFFSPVFIALIEAGEISGNLEKTLDHLGNQLKKEHKLKQNIKGAMIYPAILIIASLISISIFMVLVVPLIVKTFSQNKLILPWYTKLLMDTSSFISRNLLILTIISTALIFCLVYFRKKEFFQKLFSEIVLKIPVISDLYQKIILARFIRTLGTLLRSGIGILDAINISLKTMGHNRYQKAIADARSEIGQGVSIGNALRRKQNIFPHLVINMVSIGEKTGKLDSTLDELANFYEEEVDNDLKNLLSLLEPMLLLVMGLAVAIIAFSVIMPIYQLMGSIK